MLRKVLLAAALLLVALGLALLALGMRFFPVLVSGLAILAALLFERWRYRPPVSRPDPSWQKTGERYESPGRPGTIEVYYDPVSGERHEVAGPPDRNERR